MDDAYFYQPTPEKTAFVEKFCEIRKEDCPVSFKVAGNYQLPSTLSPADVAITAPAVQAAELKADDTAGTHGTVAIAHELNLKISNPTPQMREAKAEIVKQEAKKEKLAKLHAKHPERLARHENLVKSTAHVRAEPEPEATKLARVDIYRKRVAEAQAEAPKGTYWGGRFYAGLDAKKDIAIINSLSMQA